MALIYVCEVGETTYKRMSLSQLARRLNAQKREAQKVLKSSRAEFVVYALAWEKNGVNEYHLIACTPYTASEYSKCFCRSNGCTPYSVRKR